MNRLERLEAALIAADKAGNTEDAKVFAAEIRRLRKTGQMRRPPSGTSGKSSILRGMRDPIDAGAQALEAITPAPIAEKINRANDWIAENVGGLERLGNEGLQGQLERNEAAYQAQRKDKGFDTGRLIGNVISPANLAAAARGPQIAASMGANPFVANAATGAFMGAMSSPVTGDDLLKQKGSQVIGGAIGGAASPYLANAAARVADPVNRYATQALRNAGVKMTPGQLIGPGANRIEQQAMSSPWVGQKIAAARQDAMQDFNAGVIDQSLKAIGKGLPKGMRTDTPQALTFARKSISDEYNRILGQSKVVFDAPLIQEVSKLRMMRETWDDTLRARFDRLIQREIQGRATDSGRMGGMNVKKVDEALRDEAAKFKKAGDPMQREYGEAVAELHRSWRDAIKRSNGTEIEAQLAAADKGWALMKTAQRANTSVTNADDVFTPADYYRSIKAGDKTKDKVAFGEGWALNQQLGKDAKNILGNTYPDSGTAGRLNTSTIGGILSTLPTLGLYPMYSQAGRRAAEKLLAERGSGETSKAIADFIRRYGPIGTMPGMANLGAQGLLSL